MNTLDFVTAATTLAGLLAAGLRLANAWRPLWAWLPVPLQVALPALLVAAAQGVDLFNGVRTPLDFVQAFGLVAFALLAAWRGNPSPKTEAEMRALVREALEGSGGRTWNELETPEKERLCTVARALLGVSTLALLVLTVACSSSSPPPVRWPSPAELVACAPAPAVLEQAVRDVLKAPPAERMALLHELARKHTPEAVLCAVKQLAAAQPAEGTASAQGVVDDVARAARLLLEVIERLTRPTPCASATKTPAPALYPSQAGAGGGTSP